jgi:hypothetical protein
MGGYGYAGMGTGWLGSGDPNGLSPVSLTALRRGARSEINRVTIPLTAGVGRARKAWTGPAAARAKAVKRLPADAGRLQTRLAQSRGGRTLSRTGKTVVGGSKLGFEYTVGIPVTAPRLASSAKQGAKGGGQYLKTKTAATVRPRAEAAKEYGKTWAHHTGLSWVRGKARDGSDAIRIRTETASAAHTRANQMRDILHNRPQAVATRTERRMPDAGKSISQGKVTIPKPDKTSAPKSTPAPRPPRQGSNAKPSASDRLRRRLEEHRKNRPPQP